MHNNIKINFIYNVVYQILIIILPIVTTPYISRVFGAEIIGVYSYTYSVANYFMIVAMLGMKNYGNRQIASVRKDKIGLSKSFINMYSLQFTVAIIVFIVYITYAMLVQNYTNIALIQGIWVLSSAFDISWFFFGLEEFKTTVTRNIIVKILSIACVLIFVKEQGDLSVYSFILSTSTLIGNLTLFGFLRKYIVAIKPELKEIKKHVKPNLILFIPVVAVSIFNIMDKIMLGELSNMSQVGLYENSEKIMRLPLGIITALGTVMLPHVTHKISIGEAEETKLIIERSMIFIMFLSSALAGGLAGISKVFSPVFFGMDFVECSILIMCIAPTILSLSWANVIRMQYLIPNKMDKEFTISTIIGAVVNLIVNITLIPPLGALGAVIGTVCAETTLTIYQTFAVRKYLPIKKYLHESLPFLIIGILMSIVVYVFGNNNETSIITLVFQIVLGIVIYILLSLLYIKFTKNETIKETFKILLKI